LEFVSFLCCNDNTQRRREEKKKAKESDRFVCIDNASMCIQSSDQVSSFEIRAVKLFLDLYKQMRKKKYIFTNPDDFFLFIYNICFRKRKKTKEKKRKIHKRFKVQDYCILPGKSACGR
jgi:hypothetical protein